MTESGAQQLPPAVEPERLIRQCIELDADCDVYWLAVDSLAEGQPGLLLEMLDRSPPRTALVRATWSKVVDAAWVRRLVDRDPPDFEALDLLVARLGPAAASPLLELLTDSESLATRRQIYERVVTIGTEVLPDVIRRLDDRRWYARRNMLALIAEFERWPPKWSPAEYADDEHPAVRREALRLMLRSNDSRDRALCRLIADDDPRAQALGLAAAIEACPPDAVPLLADLAGSEIAQSEQRIMAVRALGLSGDPAAVQPLVELISRPGLLGRKLAPRSPLVLAALAALAGFRGEPVGARKLLAKAARSSDAELRAAVLGNR